MKHLACISGIAVLCAAISAQDYVTSPKGFLHKEANSNTSFSLGDYANGRFQSGDGTYRNTSMTIKGVAYRAANVIYNDSNGMGRSFANVRLMAAKCKVASFSNTYTKNHLTAPVTVFSSAVSWPTLTGKPAKYPADWTMKFPFTTNWIYDGNDDICLDYVFSGGKLLNNGTWTGATSRPFFKDSQNYPTYVTVPSMQFGYSGNNVGCNDRKSAHLRGAHIWSDLTVYSGDYGTTTARNTVRFRQWGRDFPGSHQLLTIIGFRPVREGWDLPGTTCNKVFIDFGFPVFFIPSFANSGGSQVSLDLATNNPGIGGVEIVSQVGWSDSMNGGLLVSDAALLYAPHEPRSQPVTLSYFYTTTSKTGYVNGYRPYQPVVRYTK